jgi:Xaa-Pro aminopeptidase
MPLTEIDQQALPAISDSEFSQRLTRAQKLIGDRGLDVLLVNSHEADFANVRYFSDYWTLFEIAGVAISPAGPAALLIGPESETYAADRSKLRKIHKMVEYRESADPAYPGVSVSNFEQVFKDIGVSKPKRIGVAGYLVTTAPVLDGLRQAFPEATIERADDIMVALRSIKSKDELACLRAAVKISELAAARVLEQIRPGMTEQQVVGIAQQAMYDNGAEYEAHPTYILSGRNTTHAISRPTRRRLEKNELIQLNIGARVAGYSPSVGLPICLGRMSDQQRDLVEFGLEAHGLTMSWLKAGVVAADVAKKYRQLFVDRGYAKNYLYGPCHGLGMIEVEPPWMEETSQYQLQPNMTFQVDTFLYNDAFGLRWENGGCITADGFELFGGGLRKVTEIE